MRLIRFFLLVIVCSVAAFAQPAPVGIETADLDRSANPCNDFYQFSNGAWRAANPIPATMDRWSRRWAAGEANKDQLKVILEEASAKRDLPKGSVDQLIGDYYAACMDESRVNQAGATPIKPLLADIATIKDQASLQHMLLRFADLGIQVPFGVNAASDNHNPSQVIADVQAGGLGLPDRDYYLKTEERFQQARAQYLVHVANMFQLAGYSQADSRKAADQVMQFETALAKATLDNVARRDPQAVDHKTTYAQLQQLTPHFDWDGYYKDANLPRINLNVQEPKFMEEVDRQLSTATLPDWRVYLTWQLLHGSAPFLSQPFVQENFNFYEKTLGGVGELKPRWKQCAESADQFLGEALGRDYVARYFPPEAKARAQEMVKNILAAMGDTINGLDWMTPDTKKKAMEKIATFNVKVGYPDKWKDYSHVVITRTSYFDDVMAGAQFGINDDRSTIGKPVDRGRWGMTPPTSNAYYNPLLNEIVFPAGILQPPAFNVKASDAVNYGAIGVVIGHEISHGFDDQGAQFDSTGRLNNWWTADDLKKFQAKTACVVKQFDGYYIEPNIHHNGKLVLGESIGDLAGVKIAYLAFQKSQQGKPPAPVVDGFTPDQQFFIAWGQFRGDETRPETQRLMVQGDPHPVAKFRVIGPLSNFPPFASAFSCKPDSAMVRPAAERCVVW
ncbi:MAG: M13 family metallopeptidase [Candidatus Korobacteraceae bacterium]|jgi:endothelin-converting enzyme/putative endopeptidase